MSDKIAIAMRVALHFLLFLIFTIEIRLLLPTAVPAEDWSKAFQVCLDPGTDPQVEELVQNWNNLSIHMSTEPQTRDECLAKEDETDLQFEEKENLVQNRDNSSTTKDLGFQTHDESISDFVKEGGPGPQFEEKEDLVQNRNILFAIKDLDNYAHNMTSEFAEKVHTVTEVQNQNVLSTIKTTLYNHMHKITTKFTEKVRSVQYMYWNILSTIKDTLYSYTQNMISKFAEIVRSVIREEISKLLSSIREMIVKVFTYPDFIGSLLNEFLAEVADTIMAVGLIIICIFLSCIFLLVNCIFWQLDCRVLFVLAFDLTIYLMYKMWGPAGVYSMFWWLIYSVWYLLSLLWTYTSFYLLLAVIVVFYVLSLIVLPCRRRRARQSREQQLDTIEQTVLSLSERFSRMEERQTDRVQHVVHVTIEETAARAEEMVLLRRISSDMESFAGEMQQLRTSVHSSNANITTLTDEVQQLKATVNAMSNGSFVTLTDEVKQLKATVNAMRNSNGSIVTLTDEVKQLKATVNAMRNESIVTLTDEVKQLKVTVDVASNERIDALTDEVQQLKATVTTVSNGSIATLSEEVQQLKTTVNEMHSSSVGIATLTDEVEQLKAKLNEMHSIYATLPELVQQLKVTAASIQDTVGSTVNRVPVDEVSSSHSCDTEQPSPRQCSGNDIPVSGEKMIWGTYRSTKVKEVKRTIASLITFSAGDLTITKKYSNPEEAYVERWWFVVTAEESVLLKLQEEWHSVEAETKWKLKKIPKKWS